jgi:hypothetical protein
VDGAGPGPGGRAQGTCKPLRVVKKLAYKNLETKTFFVTWPRFLSPAPSLARGGEPSLACQPIGYFFPKHLLLSTYAITVHYVHSTSVGLVQENNMKHQDHIFNMTWSKKELEELFADIAAENELRRRDVVAYEQFCKEFSEAYNHGFKEERGE